MAAPLAAVPVPPAAAAADPVVSAAGAAEVAPAETATAPAALADDAPQPDEPASEKDVDDATKPAAELVESVPEPVVPAAAAPATEAAAPAAVDEESAPSATETAAVPTPVEEPAAPAAPAEEKAVGEPSNALTAQFTDAEKSTLKEFRTLLPEIFATAYPDKADAKTAPITLWGVSIDPANPAASAKTSVVLMKFLRARNLNVAEAKTMLTNTLKWRQEFGIEAALKEEYPKDVFGSLGYISGKDKQGRPVVYNVYGGNKDMNAVFSDVQRFLRWRVAFMEKSLDLLDFETVDQAVQVHDYAGVSMSSRTPQSKQAASEASKIFGDHYPELLYKKYFVNVPTLMSFIFWTFKAILPAKTFAKMSVVGTSTNSIRDTLKDVIDVKEIPKRYGGEAEGF